MNAGERFKKWIDTTAAFFADRLKTFMSGILGWGFEVFFDVLGKAAAPKLKPLIDRIETTGEVPPELQPIIDELKEPSGETAALFAQSAGSALIGGAIGKIIDALLLPIAYGVNKLTRNAMPAEVQMITMWLRGDMKEEWLNDNLAKLGLTDDGIKWMKNLATIRLDPASWITLFRRGYEQFDKVKDDLAQQGWDTDRIEALKFSTQAFPTLSDVITFYAKEAFEPDMIEEYGLRDEMPPYEGTLFEKLGVPQEIAELYWISHWFHPAFREVTDMLHRGEITDDDVYKWYRVQEIPPKWRDKLTSISWDLPNRIELRMMARYGLVDKSFLIEQLKQVGLKEDFRDVAADMMLAMGIRTDLSTRYSKGWLTAEQVKQELIDSGLSEAVRERMYMWIVKNASGDRVASERDLTKAEIVKGVKKGVISWTQGKELLQDLGYEEWEAEYKLLIDIGAAEGSPDTYQEFKKITQTYRQSQGLSAEVPSDELVEAEKNVLRLEDEYKVAKAEKAPKNRLQTLREDLEAAKILYHQLLKPTE